MPAFIHDSDSFVLDAPGTSGDLRIDVALPPDFPEAGLARSNAPLPLVLVLDGDFLFPAAAAMSRLLMLGDARPHIVAGVGYPDGSSIARVTERRVFDFCPAGPDLPIAPGMPPFRTGGNDAFRTALIDQVLPALAERFPIDIRQIYLYGGSLGGWFAGDTLLRHRGRIFAGIGILSAAFFIDDRKVLQDLKRLMPCDLTAGFRSFVSVGTCEDEGALAGAQMRTDTGSLIDAWRAAGVPFEGHLLDGETHNMGFGPAYTRATRYFLPLPQTGMANPLESKAGAPS